MTMVGRGAWPYVLVSILVMAVVILLEASPAHAQVSDNRNFDANRLRVTPGREDILNVYSGFMPGHLEWDVGLWLNYANDPVTLNVVERSGRLDRFASLLKHRADAHFVGAIALFERFQIGLDIPVTFVQERRGRRLAESGLSRNVSAGGIGDVGLTAKMRILRADENYIDLAFIPNLTISSALPRDAYLGERKLSGTAEVAVSKTFANLTLAGNVGAKFREVVRNRVGDLTIKNELITRLGLRYDFEEALDAPLSIDGSWEGFTPLDDFLGERNSGGSEIMVGAGYELGRVEGIPFRIVSGGGLGINSGYSIPDYRVFVAFAVSYRSRDEDGDGVDDRRDRCPTTAEDMDTFEDDDGCPDPDNDADGVLDVDDQRVLEPEDVDGFEDDDGAPDPDNDADGVLDVDDRCPDTAGPSEQRGCPDRDGDGLVDGDDKCPDQAEDADGFEDSDGCEDPDNDGDGVVDTQDECVNEAGVIANRGCPDTDRDGDKVLDRLDNCPDIPGPPENNGCERKQLVTIKGCKLKLAGKIFFKSGSDRIRRVSMRILDNVVQVLKAQPQISRLRVEGHTDASGAAGLNKSLSQARADAVAAYLQRRGIAADRLQALGLGEEQPISSNESPRGQRRNRRVELIIDGCQRED